MRETIVDTTKLETRTALRVMKPLSAWLEIVTLPFQFLVMLVLIVLLMIVAGLALVFEKPGGKWDA